MHGKENARDDARQGVLEEQQRIEKLESENYELKLKIRMFERVHSAGASGPSQLETNSKELEIENAQLVDRNAELENEVKSLKKRLSSLPEQISARYQREVDDFFERVRDKLATTRKLELKVAKLNGELRYMPPPPLRTGSHGSVGSPASPASPAVVDQLNNDLAALRIAKGQVEAQLTDLQSQYDQVVQKSKGLEQELEAERNAKPQVAQRDPYVEAELQRLRISREDVAFENSHLKERISHMERTVQDLEQQLRSATKRAAEAPSLQETEEKNRSLIRRLEVQLANAKSEIESSITPHELAVAKEDLSRARIELAELQSEKKGLADKLRAAKIQLEVIENRNDELKKREAHHKTNDLRILGQKSQLEKELEKMRIARIGLEEKTQTLETTLVREARARESAEHRNTELERALARPTEPARALENSRNHLSQLQNDARENSRTRRLNLENLRSSEVRSSGSYHLNQQEEDALKARLGISS